METYTDHGKTSDERYETYLIAYFTDTIAEGESHSSLVARIVKKAGYSEEEQKAVKSGKDGAGLVYEFEGARWSLEDGELARY